MIVKLRVFTHGIGVFVLSHAQVNNVYLHRGQMELLNLYKELREDFAPLTQTLTLI